MAYLRDSSVVSRINRLYLSKLGDSFDGSRNMYSVLGYNRSPNFDDYLMRYNRQDIAKRIVDAFPNAIWSVDPIVRCCVESQDSTIFQNKFEDLSSRLKLFHYLNRLDKISGLGCYGVLLIGVNDGLSLEDPVSSNIDLEQIHFLMPFSEKNAIIYKYDSDISSARYGKPLKYKLATGGYGNSHVMETSSYIVHYSRVLHVAEEPLDNDVFGTPRLKCIFNRLDDLEKVVGGSSEIFWLNGRGGINLNAEKDADLVDEEKLSEHAEAYTHQLTRILKTKGIDVKTLQLNIHDPQQHVAVLLDLISGATGIPQRILVGSERGELASSQDRINWETRVKERRENFCEPVILRPLINKIIDLGALPKVDFVVEWSDALQQTQEEKATIAAKITQALSSYVNANGAEYVIPPEQFVEEILQMEFRRETIDELVHGEDI